MYTPLTGSTYTELPDKSKNPMKGLINNKNNDNKCFFWCHIRHLNLVKRHPERITKKDKNMINDLDYEGIKFPVSKKYYCRIERQNKICINMLCYENGLTYPVYASNQKFSDCMDLLLILNKNKSHYVYIKHFNRFMCNKTKHKNKKYFCKCCLQCFSSKQDLIEHRENCLIINGKQSAKLKSGSIIFKNYFKQLPLPFKTYADFECILKEVKVVIKIMAHRQNNIKIIVLAVLLIKLFVLIINSVKKLSFTEESKCCYRFIEAILSEYDYCRRIIKKRFNKNLIMSEEKEEKFQLTNSC